MKVKLLRLTALFLCVISLCSCSFISHALGFQGRMWGFIGNDEQVANEKVGEFYEALKAKDAEAMRQLFANNVVEETDIDAGISELFDYYQGDLVSYTVDPAVASSQKKHDGISSKILKIQLSIETTEQTYYGSIDYCVEDEGDSNNVGILHMATCLEKDDYIAYKYWDFSYPPPNGIYCFIKEQHSETSDSLQTT